MHLAFHYGELGHREKYVADVTHSLEEVKERSLLLENQMNFESDFLNDQILVRHAESTSTPSMPLYYLGGATDSLSP